MHSYRFLAKTTSLFTFFGFNKLLSGVTTLPAVANTRSEGELVYSQSWPLTQSSSCLPSTMQVGHCPQLVHLLAGRLQEGLPSVSVTGCFDFQKRLPSEGLFFWGGGIGATGCSVSSSFTLTLTCPVVCLLQNDTISASNQSFGAFALNRVAQSCFKNKRLISPIACIIIIA